MKTALELREVAKTEVSNGGVITMQLADGGKLDIGIRMRNCFGIRHFLFGVQRLVHEDRFFAAALYQAGMDSRNPATGHGYIILYTDRILVPWTKWSEADRNPTPGQRNTPDHAVYNLVPATQHRLRDIVAEQANYVELLAQTIKRNLELPGPYQI